MDSFDRQKLEQDVRKKIGRFITTDSKRLNPRLYGVLEEIRRKDYPAFLCGGAIRDLLFHNSMPRDLDIIIGYASDEQLESLFPSYLKGRTGLGGIKIQIKDWSVDLWSLNNTWAFKEGKFDGKGFSDYPKVTFLNIDAIAVQLFSRRRKKREIYSQGFFEAIFTKTIELNFDENPSPTKCITRALYMANKYKYKLGPKLAKYLLSHVKQIEAEEIAEIYQRRYMDVNITTEKLYYCIDNIKTQLNSSSRSSVIISFGREENLNYCPALTTPALF